MADCESIVIDLHGQYWFVNKNILQLRITDIEHSSKQLCEDYLFICKIVIPRKLAQCSEITSNRMYWSYVGGIDFRIYLQLTAPDLLLYAMAKE